MVSCHVPGILFTCSSHTCCFTNMGGGGGGWHLQMLPPSKPTNPPCGLFFNPKQNMLSHLDILGPNTMEGNSDLKCKGGLPQMKHYVCWALWTLCAENSSSVSVSNTWRDHTYICSPSSLMGDNTETVALIRALEPSPAEVARGRFFIVSVDAGQVLGGEAAGSQVFPPASPL